MAYIDDRRFAVRDGEKTPTGYKGKPWRARWRDPVTGKERAKHFERKLDAERFLDTVRTDLNQGTYVDPSAGKVPFVEYANLWFSTKADLRPRSRINVEGRLKNHLIPAFGQRPIAQIRPADVRAWVAQIAAVRAPATVKAAYNVLAQIMRTADTCRPCIQMSGQSTSSPASWTRATEATASTCESSA